VITLPPSLLAKLASVVVHAAELLDPEKGHAFDELALRQLLLDPEVRSWAEEMIASAIAPMPRTGSKLTEVKP